MYVTLLFILLHAKLGHSWLVLNWAWNTAKLADFGMIKPIGIRFMLVLPWLWNDITIQRQTLFFKKWLQIWMTFDIDIFYLWHGNYKSPNNIFPIKDMQIFQDFEIHMFHTAQNFSQQLLLDTESLEILYYQVTFRWQTLEDILLL